MLKTMLLLTWVRDLLAVLEVAARAARVLSLGLAVTCLVSAVALVLAGSPEGNLVAGAGILSFIGMLGCSFVVLLCQELASMCQRL